MKKSLRFSSLLLALLLILTLPAGAYSAQSLVPQARTYTGSFTDISGLWCEDAVVTCYESGLLSGKTGRTFPMTSRMAAPEHENLIRTEHRHIVGGDAAFPIANAIGPPPPHFLQPHSHCVFHLTLLFLKNQNLFF